MFALPIHLHHYWERALVVKESDLLSESEEECVGESSVMTVLEWWDVWVTEGPAHGLAFLIGCVSHAVR